jgi:hypothetical protein
MIALFCAVLGSVLIIGRHEFAEILAGLVTRFRR